jgi:hypothetical protein
MALAALEHKYKLAPYGKAVVGQGAFVSLQDCLPHFHRSPLASTELGTYTERLKKRLEGKWQLRNRVSRGK